MKYAISIPVQPLILVVLGVFTIIALGWAMFVEQERIDPLITIRSGKSDFPDADEQQAILDQDTEAWAFRGIASERYYDVIASSIGTKVAAGEFSASDTLPADTFISQVSRIFRLGDVSFATVLQRNKYSIVEPAGQPVYWAGVILKLSDTNEWKKFYMIQDPEGSDELATLPHNVVGIFTGNNVLYMDIADAAGSGVGGGMMTRLVSSDGGKTWKKSGCYYFNPGEYFTSDGLVDELAKVESSSYCRYGE